MEFQTEFTIQNVSIKSNMIDDNLFINTIYNTKCFY